MSPLIEVESLNTLTLRRISITCIFIHFKINRYPLVRLTSVHRVNLAISSGSPLVYNNQIQRTKEIIL